MVRLIQNVPIVSPDSWVHSSVCWFHTVATQKSLVTHANTHLFPTRLSVRPVPFFVQLQLIPSVYFLSVASLISYYMVSILVAKNMLCNSMHLQYIITFTSDRWQNKVAPHEFLCGWIAFAHCVGMGIRQRALEQEKGGCPDLALPQALQTKGSSSELNCPYGTLAKATACFFEVIPQKESCELCSCCHIPFYLSSYLKGSTMAIALWQSTDFESHNYIANFFGPAGFQSKPGMCGVFLRLRLKMAT